MNSWFMILRNDSNSSKLELLYPILMHYLARTRMKVQFIHWIHIISMLCVCVFVFSQNDVMDINEVTSLWYSQECLALACLLLITTEVVQPFCKNPFKQMRGDLAASLYVNSSEVGSSHWHLRNKTNTIKNTWIYYTGRLTGILIITYNSAFSIG